MEFKIICVNENCLHWERGGLLVSGAIEIKHCTRLYKNTPAVLAIGKCGCLAAQDREVQP